MNKHALLVGALALGALSAKADLVNRYTFVGSNGNDVTGAANLATTGTVSYAGTGLPAGLTRYAEVTNNPDGNSAALSYLSLTSGLTGGLSFTNFSVSLWFNETASLTNRYNDILAISGAAGAQTNLEFMTRGTAGTAAAAVNNEGAFSPDNAAWTTGTWHHAAFVGGGSGLSYYLDGALVGTATVTPAGNIAELYLFRGGNFNSGNVRGWNGRIADVQLYNQNLTGAEVASLAANAGTAIPEPSTYGLIGAGALVGVAMVRRRGRVK